jgi:hypothetical protein
MVKVRVRGATRGRRDSPVPNSSHQYRAAARLFCVSISGLFSHASEISGFVFPRSSNLAAAVAQQETQQHRSPADQAAGPPSPAPCPH